MLLSKVGEWYANCVFRSPQLLRCTLKYIYTTLVSALNSMRNLRPSTILVWYLWPHPAERMFSACSWDDFKLHDCFPGILP